MASAVPPPPPPPLTSAARRRALLGCLLTAASAGFIYDFSVYSGALKRTFRLSQSQLDWVATASIFVFWMSPLVGRVADTIGPRLTNAAGGAVMTLGLLAQWAYAAGICNETLLPRDPASATLILSACTSVVTVGANAAAAVAFSVPVKLYPRSRGYVTGLVKSFWSLMGGLLAQMYTLLVAPPNDDPSTLGFLLFLAGTTLAVNVLIAPLLLPRSGETSLTSPQSSPGLAARSGWGGAPIRVRVKHACLVTLFLIAAVFLSSVLTAVPTTTAKAATGTNAAVVPTRSAGAIVMSLVFTLLMSGTCAALVYPSCSSSSPPPPALLFSSSPSSSSSSLLSARTRYGPLLASVAEEPTGDTPSSRPHAEDEASNQDLVDVRTLRMLGRVNFWLLLLAGSILVGGGYIITTNSFQIVESSGLAEASAGTAITLFSAVQGLTRMVSGIGPDHLGDGGSAGSTAGSGAQRLRLVFLCGFCIAMGVAHVLLWLAPRIDSVAVFYSGYVLAGAGFGGIWPIMVCVAADIWGVKNLGANYMVFDGTTAFVGALMLGKLLPQAVYSAHSSAGATSCTGAECFALTHLVETGCCAVAVAASAVLLWRRSKVEGT